MPRAGLEPASLSAADFKSAVYTSSTIPASVTLQPTKYPNTRDGYR